MILIISFIVTLVLLAIALKVAPSLGLMANVGGHRQHEKPTPVIGGLAMFIAICFILLLCSKAATTDASLIYHYLLGAALLVITGALDDRYHIPFFYRFIVQIIATLLMIQHGNILHSLGQLFTKDFLLLGDFAIPMTIFATVGVINAINMSDGLDGMAGGFCLLVFLVFLSFPFVETYQLISLVWIGALAAFLLFNLRTIRPARLFMGDAGSTVLGYTIAWMFIFGSQQAIETVPESRYFTPVFAVWVLALPLFDTISLMLIRVAEGKSPFSADLGHMHHHLLKKFKSVNLVLIILLVWFLFYIALGYGLNSLKIATYQQTLIFAACFAMHIALQAYLRRKNTL